MPEPVAARKRALLKKQTWEEFFAKHGERNTKPYEFRDTYRENAIVFHPKFGKGYVSEVVSESKVEITFSDARRILVHNRKDIPGSPVGREDDGLPSTTAPVKAGGKGAAKAVDKQAAKQAQAAKAAPAPQAPKAALAHKAALPAKAALESKVVPAPKTAAAPSAKAALAPKAPAKKVVEEKKAVAKKPAEKKALVGKAAEKKPVAKKAPAAKQPVSKKPLAKKPADKKLAKKKSK
jgi:hypothetical protein